MFHEKSLLNLWQKWNYLRLWRLLLFRLCLLLLRFCLLFLFLCLHRLRLCLQLPQLCLHLLWLCFTFLYLWSKGFVPHRAFSQHWSLNIVICLWYFLFCWFWLFYDFAFLPDLLQLLKQLCGVVNFLYSFFLGSKDLISLFILPLLNHLCFSNWKNLISSCLLNLHFVDLFRTTLKNNIFFNFMYFFYLFLALLHVTLTLLIVRHIQGINNRSPICRFWWFIFLLFYLSSNFSHRLLIKISLFIPRIVSFFLPLTFSYKTASFFSGNHCLGSILHPKKSP